MQTPKQDSASTLKQVTAPNPNLDKLIQYLCEQATKSRPVFPKDVWQIIFYKMLDEKDLNNARLACRYLNGALAPIWDDLELKKSTYRHVFLDHQIPDHKVRVPTLCKNDGWVYFSHEPNKRVIPWSYLQRTLAYGYAHNLIQKKQQNQVISVLKGIGSNQYGQLAQPDVDRTGLSDNAYLQSQINNTVDVKDPVSLSLAPGLLMTKVSCGFQHTAILTTCGRVFVCGKNMDGQLGIGNSVNQYELQEVTFNEEIIDVVAGAEHTLFLGKSNTIYGAGRNSDGQLGATEDEYYETPIKLDTPPNVQKIFAGSATSFLIDDLGALFVTGCNSSSQTGIPTVGNIYGFTKVDNLPAMSAIFSSQYWSLGISREQRLYCTGYSPSGLLGGKKVFASRVVKWQELEDRYQKLRALQAKRKVISAPITTGWQFLDELAAAITTGLSAYAQSTKISVATAFFKKAPRAADVNQLSTVISKYFDNNHSAFEKCEHLVEQLSKKTFDGSTTVNVGSYVLEAIQSNSALVSVIDSLKKSQDWVKVSSKVPAILLTLVTEIRNQIKSGKAGELQTEFANMLCEDPKLDQPTP